MTTEEKLTKRKAILVLAESLLNIPYKLGAKCEDLEKTPLLIDCSGFVRYCFRKCGLDIPDGSSNQYNFTQRRTTYEDAEDGDLGFFMNEKGIHHVGILYSDLNVIEARGDPYNKVIYRPRIAWQNFDQFTGWRKHPEL